MTYEDVSWNVTSIGQEIDNGLTEAAFVERGLAQGYYRDFSPANRAVLLKEAYRLINLSYLNLVRSGSSTLSLH